MKRAWIKKTFPRFLVFLTIALISISIFKTETTHIDPVSVRIVPDTIPIPVETLPKIEDPEPFFDYLVDDTLFYHGYELKKVDVRVPWSCPESCSIDATHVVLLRDGITIAEFDGVYHILGNLADFGFANLLGTSSEQLIISLTISRGGRHLIITLDPAFRVLFDSGDFDVGRETVSIVDIDKDGVQEICLPIVSYYGMEGLQSIGETPLPEIIFKYDAKRMKYLPANHLFVDYVFRHSNPENEKETYQHHRFNVLLDYIYAGKEKEGWVSFDKHYPSPDKEVMRSRIKAILKDDPVYKYIYKNSER